MATATTTGQATAPDPATGGPGDDALDTSIRMVTPERITFRYPLAGPFRRSLAYLLDLILMAMIVAASLFAAGLFGMVLGQAVLGLVFVEVFLLIWGYGAFWEGLFNGQTPGKRALGIRVVSDQGVPITGAQAVLRNLLWFFDGLMMGYIPAVACMVLTRKFQRLGDLAAGTMVMVEDQPPRGRLPRVDDEATRAALPLLPVRVEAGPELARALADYVKARPRFGRDRRQEMAEHLARPLRRRYALPADVPADAILCALYNRVFLGD